MSWVSFFSFSKRQASAKIFYLFLITVFLKSNYCFVILFIYTFQVIFLAQFGNNSLSLKFTHIAVTLCYFAVFHLLLDGYCIISLCSVSIYSFVLWMNLDDTFCETLQFLKLPHRLPEIIIFYIVNIFLF